MTVSSAAADVDRRGVTTRFGGVTAIDELDLELRHGDFLSLPGSSAATRRVDMTDLTTVVLDVGGLD